jgi:hypothetical protein
MDKISVSFIINAFGISIALVTFYALIVNGVIYFLVRKKRHREMFVSLMKKAFVKLPFLLTGYGYLAGLIVYVGVALINALFGQNGHTSIPGSGTQSDGPEIGLIVFTFIGFCISVGVGWAAFIKEYRATNSSISKNSGK